MARTREKLDQFQQAFEVAARLKTQAPGKERERLMAVHLGLLGEMNLEQIAQAVGRARATIQGWFNAYRRGGIDALLADARVRNHGPQGLLNMTQKQRLGDEISRARFRSAPQMQRWINEELNVKVAQSTIYKWLRKFGARMLVPRPSHVKKKKQRRGNSKQR